MARIRQMGMKGLKKSKFFHLILFLGAFIILNAFNDSGSNADKSIENPVVAQSGVFISKYNQHPVFTMGSKVSAAEDVAGSKDVLISYAYQASEGVPEELIKAAVDGQKKGFHLLVDLNEGEIKENDLADILEQIAQHELSFWVSLMPGPDMSPRDYDRFYQRLRTDLSRHDIENISLVWYPDTSYFEGREEADWDEIDGVGVNISGPGDMAKLDRLYQVFADKKEIVVNEHIIDANRQDLPQGMAFLEQFYYGLAIQYPAVTAVYQSSDLSRADVKYRNAVEGFKQKSWVTNLVLETTNQPMFEALASDMVLTDKVEFLYRPQDDRYQDIAYVEYKFNTGRIIQAGRPPFVINLDTNELHNGINFLAAVVYDKQLRIMNKSQIYFEVGNDNIPPRAKRIGKVYSKEQKPVYASSYIPVLMYHDFAPQVSKDKESNTVAAGLFEKQLKALLDQGYTLVTFYDLDQYLNKKAGLPLKPVIVTADDSYLSNYTIAYPLLKKYKVSATFFVVTGFIGVKTQSDHITWEQAKEMEESGLIDIQSHTHTHRLFNEMKEEEVLYETSMSFGLIEKNLGQRDVKVLSYPEFRNTMDTKKWVAGQGVDLQVTSLAREKPVTTRQSIQRIHVHNKMSPQELIRTIKKLTM